MKRNTIGFLLFVLLTTFPALVMAQEADSNQDPVSTSDQDIQVPESYLERMRRVSTVMELSLQESIRMALADNLEIAIENYNEDLNREQIVRTRGFYDPTLSFTVGWNSRKRPNTSVLESGGGILVNVNDGFTFDTNLNQNVQGGGALRLTWNNGRSETNSQFFNVNPSYNTNFDISFTQPLWRGFGKKTATERQIKIANLDTEISDTQFKQRVVEIIQQVQNQYWELVYAIQNHEAQRKSVELAIVQHRNNRKRVEIGVMAPIEITSSHAEVATREQSLIQSEVQIINAQNDLKRMLAPDPSASIWNLILIPIDRPRMRDVTVTLQEAIETSIRNRPELERVKLQMEQNEVDRRFLHPRRETDRGPESQLRKHRKPRERCSRRLPVKFSSGQLRFPIRTIPVSGPSERPGTRPLALTSPAGESFSMSRFHCAIAPTTRTWRWWGFPSASSTAR